MKKQYSTNVLLQTPEHKFFFFLFFLSSLLSTLGFIWDKLLFILHTMFCYSLVRNENVFRHGCWGKKPWLVCCQHLPC